ncbi:MAG: hypothetical protein K6G51_01975 [Sphaerochaetaceae bacterium]|nr:hypothetical protein [Sphaerochaetaceae bacterium]
MKEFFTPLFLPFAKAIKNPTDGKKEVNRSGEQKEVNLFNQEFYLPDGCTIL